MIRSRGLQALWPSIILGGGVLLISGMRAQYVMAPAQPMRAIPTQIAGTTGVDLEVPAEERRIAAMSDYSMRSFGPDSAPDFTIYVGYYDRQVQGRAIHSPKNCLPGAGWEILTTARVPAPGAVHGTMNRVMLANGGARALVYYWYQGRGRVEANEYTVKWNLLRDAVRFGRTEEALVRVVVPVAMPRGTDRTDRVASAEAAADSVGLRVAATLVPAVTQVLPPPPAR